MIFSTMYPPQKDSPSTSLAGAIDSVETSIIVTDASVLPQEAPFPLTIGYEKSITEVVIVTSINTSNNQLQVERGVPAYTWVAGVKCARVFNSQDLASVQNNIKELFPSVEAQNAKIDTNTTNIGINTIKIDTLTDDFNDEKSRINDALILESTTREDADTVLRSDLDSEIDRSITKDNELQNDKINKADVPSMVTDLTLNPSISSNILTFKSYNAETNVTTNKNVAFTIASNILAGIILPETYSEIQNLRTTVNNLINQGGRFIGISFATKASLDAYVVPATVNVGDFTYVEDDETHDDATTRYIYNGTQFDFAYVIDYDPIEIATNLIPGLVKSDNGSSYGKIFVESDGTMSVLGWDLLLDELARKVSANDSIINFKMNGTQVDSITLNQATGKDINFVAPTANNSLINFKANNVQVDSITLNQATGKDINFSIPTVNDPSINFKLNGTVIGSITLNQAAGKDIEIEIPIVYVDDSLSTSSTNAIQNKAVSEGLNSKASLSGATFTGDVIVPAGTNYTTYKVRNIALSTTAATPTGNGNLLGVYT